MEEDPGRRREEEEEKGVERRDLVRTRNDEENYLIIPVRTVNTFIRAN